MKRILSLIVALAMVLSIAPFAFADGEISIFLDGEKLNPVNVNGDPVSPFIIDGTTYLPVRAIATALDLEITWEKETRSVFIGEEVEAELGDEVNIFINGYEFIATDVTGKVVYPIIVDGSTFLPVRAISEAFGKTVSWDGETKSVYIVSGKGEDEIGGNYCIITNVATGKVLTVEGASTENLGRIVTADADGSDAQVWLLTKVGNGIYSVLNKNSIKVLDVCDAATEETDNLIQYTNYNNQNQKWVFTPVGDAYTIQARHSMLYLDGTNEYCAQMNESGEDAQLWQVEVVEEGVLKKILASEGYALLPEQLQRAFSTYMFSTLNDAMSVSGKAVAHYVENDYFNQTPEKQAMLLAETLPYTASGQIGGSKADKTVPEYEITKKEYIESFDIWRGDMRPVWQYSVTMKGDVEGQIHNFDMTSTVEDSPVVENAIRALGVFPYAVRKNVRHLYFKYGDTANSYNGGGDSIWIRVEYEPGFDSIANVFAHELGHVVDQAYLPKFEAWTWAEALDGVPISSYGSSNQAEDLAEFHRYFWFTLDTEYEDELLRVYPNRDKVVKALLYRSDSEYFVNYKSESDWLDEFVKTIEQTQAVLRASSDPSIIEEGAYYKIVDKASGKVMTVENASLDNNVPIRLEEYTGDDSQLFCFEVSDENLVKIINRASLASLQLSTSAMSTKPIVQYGGTWSMNEEFAIINKGDSVNFMSLVYNLAISAGENYAIGYPTASDWELVKVTDFVAPTYYTLSPLSGGGNLTGGEKLAELTVEESNDSDSQKWELKKRSGGNVSLVNRATEFVADVLDVSTEPGASLISWSYTGANNQHFVVEEVSGGVTLKVVNSGLYLTASDGKITQEEYTGEKNQIFKLTEVE